MKALALALTIGLGSPLLFGQGVVRVHAAATSVGDQPLVADRPPVEWLRRNAWPLATHEPGARERDLAPLRSVIGNARIAALGEVSCGTHEFIQTKRRIVEHLATHMGFTLLAFEMSPVAAHDLNEYVESGRGDPKALIAGLSPRWRTREFLDFVEGMREFHRSGRGRLRVLGFDMLGSTDSAAAAVTRFIARAEPAYLDSVIHAYRLVETAPRMEALSGGTPALFPAFEAAGHWLRLGVWIRTENVHNGSAQVWLNGDASRKAVVRASTPDVSGTTPWTPYEFTIEVPDSISTIRFGCMLQGGGSAWFDSLTVEIDGRPFAGNEDLDLTMERTDRAVGFSNFGAQGGAYVVEMDSTTALTGKRSLCIRRVTPMPPPATATWPEASEAASRVLAYLEAGRDRLLSTSPRADVDRTIQSARTIAQMSDVNAAPGGRREDIMSANIARMLTEAPRGSRMVVWEQNRRLARRLSLGARLATRYGRELVVVGFAFHEGRYNAVAQGEPPGDRVAKPSAPGSLEWACHSTGIPGFMLDLRRASADPRATAWLTRPLPMRNYAFQAVPDEVPVGQYFDALIYFDHTTPTESLP